jgi:putative CocE/NonD family hydrolase
MSYRGGALSLGAALWACWMSGREYGDPSAWDPWRLPLVELDAAMGLHSPILQEMLGHPSRDQFWDRVDAAPLPENIRIPVLHYGGWYDVILAGTLEGWRRAAGARVEGGEGADQRLIIGPHDHCLTPFAYGGAPDTSPGAWSFDHVQRFFERHLRDEEDALDGVAPVRVFVMGAECWREADDWPLPETRFTRYYLRGGGAANSAAGDGRLDTAPPGDEPPDTFVYDPRHPVDVWLGESAWDLTWTIRDRRAVEDREDVLVYTTAPLDSDLEIVGPITVTLYAASSAPDTDFTAALVDVAADGRTHVLQEGIVRARYRSSDRRPRLISRYEVLAYEIDLAATGYLVPAGHRLRLEVSSSNFGRFDRNQNTGGALSRDSRCAMARQVVHHSRAYPSHVTLPVVPNGGGVESPPTGAPAK